MSGFNAIRRGIVAVAAGGLALGGLAGCKSAEPMPSIAFPSASAGTPVAAQIAASAAPSYTGYAPPLNAITAQFSGIPANVTFRYPMTAVTFTVTLKNASGFAFKSLDPLLVFGQCTCSPANYHIAPSTTLELWDTATNAWKSIQPAEMDPKLLFKYASQLGSIDLGPKASVTYKYRVALSRTTGKATGLVNGTGSLNVYVLQLPKHTRLSAGIDPEASVPLAYAFK